MANNKIQKAFKLDPNSFKDLLSDTNTLNYCNMIYFKQKLHSQIYDCQTDQSDLKITSMVSSLLNSTCMTVHS